MDGDHPIALLMFFTLIAGVVIGSGSFIYFLRRRYNRYLAEEALIGRDGHSGTTAPDGALPEIIGLLAIALVVMGLLFLGYATR